MTNPTVIHGVPRPILHDAWWMESASRAAAPPPPSRSDAAEGPPRKPPIAAGLVGLVLLADFLFWNEYLGLSVALFLLAIFAVATLDIRPRAQLWRPVGVLLLGILPLLEHLQLLSVVLGLIALSVALVQARGATGGDVAARASGLLLRLPIAGMVDLVRGIWGRRAGSAEQGSARSWLGALWRDWAFPVMGLGLLAALLVEANPLLDRWLAGLPDDILMQGRLVFWLWAALLIWPLISRRPGAGLRLRAGALGQLSPHPRAVARALVLFNAALAVQTVMDLTILFGGARLPEGMSYATYAHRGAYPLIATAMLAGGFALIARPHLNRHAALRPLMALWLGQNILLCLGAMLRLDLYIDAYGLTYLRVWAAIWMVLVAAGLSLTGWQIWREHSGAWLLRHVTVLGLGTLYAVSFVNIAALIADYNLRGWTPQDGTDYPGLSYTMRLPGTAHGAIMRHLGAEAEDMWADYVPWVETAPLQIYGWRDWGFRSWRVARYIADMQDDIGQVLP